MDGMNEIKRNLALMVERMKAQAMSAADESGHLLSSYAKSIAPWRDRTSNLRNSITFDTSTSDKAVRITVFETMSYAPFVEGGTRRSRPYPSLWPAVADNVHNVQAIFARHMKV